MVHEALLTPERLDRFKLLILADAAALSDAQCAAIRAYVAARRQPAWRPSPRRSTTSTAGAAPTSGWRTSSACRSPASVDGPMQNSYLSLDADPATGRRHAVLEGLEDTPRIINGVFRVQVTPTTSFPSPLTLIPTYPDLPMEDVYPRVAHTDSRELYLRESGASRIAYIPWDIDRTFWEVLSVDHGRLLANVVAWATNEPRPVEVTGPGLIDVTIWRQRGSLTVHLVNLTNPMMMKGPLREVIPIGPLVTRIRLPEGTRPGKVRLLTAGAAPRTTLAAGVLTVTVPSIDVHEVVAVDLA